MDPVKPILNKNIISSLIIFFCFFQLCLAETHTPISTSIVHPIKKSHAKHIAHKKSARRKNVYHAQHKILLPPPVVVPPVHTNLVASLGQHLVSFVMNTVDTLNFTKYKFGGSRFDISHGVYVLDCSSYVDHILQKVYPLAYSKLVNATGSDRPTTQHYYDFFSGLTDHSKHYWSKVGDVSNLQPGDILVYRFKNDTGGHVMVVMDKPVRDYSNAFAVRVADSASGAHSDDTRQHHTSGIGIGTLLLRVNKKTGTPSAVAWRIGSPWQKNVNIAMARPIDNNHL